MLQGLYRYMCGMEIGKSVRIPLLVTFIMHECSCYLGYTGYLYDIEVDQLLC